MNHCHSPRGLSVPAVSVAMFISLDYDNLLP